MHLHGALIGERRCHYLLSLKKANVLVNIYALNDVTQQTVFYNKINKHLEEFVQDIIIGGRLNRALTSNDKERETYHQKIHRLKKTQNSATSTTLEINGEPLYLTYSVTLSSKKNAISCMFLKPTTPLYQSSFSLKN